MSSEPVLPRNDNPAKGATPVAPPKPPLLEHLRAEVLQLMPASLSYSARLFIALSLLTLVSALLVIYAAYENRQAYAQLQTLEQQQRHYEVEWGQLLLERSTLASPSRIEALARHSLQMTQIPADKVEVIDVRRLERSPGEPVPSSLKLPVGQSGD